MYSRHSGQTATKAGGGGRVSPAIGTPEIGNVTIQPFFLPPPNTNQYTVLLIWNRLYFLPNAVKTLKPYLLKKE